MQLDEFLQTVCELGGLRDQEEAMTASTATLSVLGERLKGGEPRNLAAQLPDELQAALDVTGPGERFDVAELERRVAEREGGLPLERAHRHAAAVLGTLARAVSPGEIDDVLSQLPASWAVLTDEA